MRRRAGTTVAAMFGVLAVASAPAAAFVCHPDAPGTRSLTVVGPVYGYALGARVEIWHGDVGACYRTLWDPIAAKPSASRTHVACASITSGTVGASVAISNVGARPAARDGATRAVVGAGGTIDVFRGGRMLRQLHRESREPLAKLALDGDRLVGVVLGDEARDVPSRLEVYSVGRGTLLRSISLVDRPRTLAVSGDIAVFATLGGHGTFAVRLSDGRTTFVSPTRAFDRPQFGHTGVVFQSNLYKRFAASGRVVVKFVPTRVLRRGLEETFTELTTRWPIRALAMDGPRVALSLDAPRGTCDEVRYWNIPWHYLIRVSMRVDVTCARTMDIRGVALGGITSAWLGEWGREKLVIASDSKSCVERIIGEPSSSRGVVLAGDRRLLAFAMPAVRPGHTAIALARVLAGDRVVAPRVLDVGARVLALAVDSNQVAVLRDDGRVELRNVHGRVLRTIVAPETRAIALRGNRIFLLGRTGRLEARDTRTLALRGSWRLAEPPVTLDVQYGIAVTASKTAVRALDLATSRTATLTRRADPSLVGIEASGIVFGHNDRGHGLLRTLSLPEVERLLKRG
jgi:hypothetical protein